MGARAAIEGAILALVRMLSSDGLLDDFELIAPASRRLLAYQLPKRARRRTGGVRAAQSHDGDRTGAHAPQRAAAPCRLAWRTAPARLVLKSWIASRPGPWGTRPARPADAARFGEAFAARAVPKTKSWRLQHSLSSQGWVHITLLIMIQSQMVTYPQHGLGGGPTAHACPVRVRMHTTTTP